MANDNENPGFGPAIAFGIIISVFVAAISVTVTLLLSAQERIDQVSAEKADKQEVVDRTADRWTGSMERIKAECNERKEFLRHESERLRDVVKDEQIKALEWKLRYEDKIDELTSLKMMCVQGVTP